MSNLPARLRRFLWVVCTPVLAIAWGFEAPADLFAVDGQPGARRPTAGVFLQDGKTLYIANRGNANQGTGTVSIVDVELGRVINEVAVGDSLVDLIAVPGRPQLLAVDGRQNELLVLAVSGPKVHVHSRWPVSRGATQVVASPDGQQASVACQWSHCLDVVSLAEKSGARDQPTQPHLLRRVTLPFAPGLQCLTAAGNQVIVADHFGGRLGIVDLASGQVLHAFDSNGHNSRGLLVTDQGRQLVIAQQILNETLPTTEENIERGLLMQNVLRSLALSELTGRASSVDEIRPLPTGRVLPLGGLHAGAGDPAAVVSLDTNRLAVALSGVHQIALQSTSSEQPSVAVRIPTGRRPVAIIPRPGSRQLAVLNQLDDTISMVDVERGMVMQTIPLGERRSLSPQERGEQLFFDATLSRDGWLSCHSCHPDGHSNGRRVDTLGDNTLGTPKRTLSLLGTAFTYRWAWNGEVANLHDQVRKSLKETMHGGHIRDEEVRDLTSFLHTLAPPPAVLPLATSAEDQASLDRGRQVFNRYRCSGCHIPPIVYSSHESYEVGLSDERGLTKFNPPSLRGVSQGFRYFHDNRAETLESIFAEFQHPGSTVLKSAEIKDLVRYLKSL